MVKLNVIETVKEPSEWVNSMVIVEKPNGKLRICFDPKDLNKAIKRHHLKLPTTEEILAKMSGSKWFTKVDASTRLLHSLCYRRFSLPLNAHALIMYTK